MHAEAGPAVRQQRQSSDVFSVCFLKMTDQALSRRDSTTFPVSVEVGLTMAQGLRLREWPRPLPDSSESKYCRMRSNLGVQRYSGNVGGVRNNESEVRKGMCRSPRRNNLDLADAGRHWHHFRGVGSKGLVEEVEQGSPTEWRLPPDSLVVNPRL